MTLKTARVLDKTAVLIAAVILSANTYGFPSQAFWDDALRNHPYIIVSLLAVIGGFGVFAPVETLSARSRSVRSVTIRQQILTAFGHLLELGNTVTPSLGVSDLGLHVWRKRRTLRHPLRGVLSRVATYRVGTNPMNRPFSPPRGIGVVGLCWKHDQEVGVDVEHLASSLTTKQQFAQYRQEHGGDAVMNLTWEQFGRLKHRGAVFAFPIRNGRNSFIGCLSVDASRGFATLNRQALKDQMSLLSIVIGQAGFESI
jgi:hypothetical protein